MAKGGSREKALGTGRRFLFLAKFGLSLFMMFAASQGAMDSLVAMAGFAPTFGPLLAVPFGLVALFALKELMLEKMPGMFELLGTGLALSCLMLCEDRGAKLWQVPQDYTMLRQISPIGALFALGYLFICIASAYGRAHRPMRFVELLFALATPFLFTLILALGGSGLMHDVGWRACLHLLTDDHTLVYAGRMVTLFIVSEAITLGLGMIVFRTPRSLRLHGLLLGASVLAAITPLVADLPATPDLASYLRAPVAIVLVGLAEAGLWSLVFLLTGVIIDGLRGKPPQFAAVFQHWSSGFVKGGIYGALFLALILGVDAVVSSPFLTDLMARFSVPSGLLMGLFSYPLVETLVSSADATPPFFGRLIKAYGQPRSYARGAIVGAGLGFAIDTGVLMENDWIRFIYCLNLGMIAYAGVDLAFDFVAIVQGKRSRLQTPRLYLIGIALGGLVGGAMGWYIDANQLAVITQKFLAYANLDYAGSGAGANPYVIYPLFNKYGVMDLGVVTGGARLLYNESLSGVINWSLAAPLFSLNFVLLASLLQRSLKPLRGLFTVGGLDTLVEQGVRVLRWGLWMAPVIFSFLRMATSPDWYNQDGLVHTLMAIFARASLSYGDFSIWSLSIFTGLLAYDWLRVMIWLDHMGLRVATLVNLSFLAGDMGDENAARYVGHNAKTKIIPDGIRRFGTWAPLLIPFYIPRGADWDKAWTSAEQLAKTQAAVPPSVMVLALCYGLAVLGFAIGCYFMARQMHKSSRAGVVRMNAFFEAKPLPNAQLDIMPERVMAMPRHYRLSNGALVLDINADGRGAISIEGSARNGGFIDLSRRPTDALQLRGPFFFLTEFGSDVPFSLTYEPTRHVGDDYTVKLSTGKSIVYSHSYNGFKLELKGTLAPEETLLRWDIAITDISGRERHITLTRFLELALNEPGAYVRDPDYNAMHVETWFYAPLKGIMARNRLLRTRDADPIHKRISPEVSLHTLHLTHGRGEFAGYEDSRTNFVGAGSLNHPSGLDSYLLRSVKDEGRLDTFDPACVMAYKVKVYPRETVRFTAFDALGENPASACAMIAKRLKLQKPDMAALEETLFKQRVLRPVQVRVEAGFLPPLTLVKPGEPAPSRVFAFDDETTTLHLSPATPRPWAHVMGNGLGFGTMVNNDGEVYSLYGNARHNGLTALRFESIGTPLPGQLIYVATLETGEIDTPALIPFQNSNHHHIVDYAPGVATFVKSTRTLALAAEIFTPPDAPLDIRLLTLRNLDKVAHTYRITPYFDMALDENPQDSASHLTADHDEATGSLLFTNPKNNFVRGVAFAKVSFRPEQITTVRAHFLGKKPRDLKNPVMVTMGAPDLGAKDDQRRVAAFNGTVKLAPGEEAQVAIVLGQAQSREEALRLAAHYGQLGNARKALEDTRHFWHQQTSHVRITTNRPDFDRLVNDWFPYQMMASRLFARLGPNQRGGALGYRDQLQDVLPLVFSDPARCRAQILLHAGQQFSNGDVLKWWHKAPNGKTGLGQRTRASDPHVWLPYVTARYIAATGDASILDERVPYLEGASVPDGTDAILIAPRESMDVASVYEHCKRALDFALSRRGDHGLPHIGTGDWNDGIDIAGFKEKGESVWLGFFLYETLQSFAPFIAAKEQESRAEHYRTQAGSLAKALECAWNGEFYLLNISDDGTPMNFPNAMTTGWPMLSGAVDRVRGRDALEGALRFIERDDRVLLVTPPFSDDSIPYPGRIADYPPGVRENGGQYTHGATWIVDAYVRLALLDAEAREPKKAREAFARAFEIWQKISPLGKTHGEALSVYGLAPHQQPADIYDGAGHDGRGGWSWYTGSAARMVSAAYALLGIEMVNGVIVLREDAFMPKGDLQLLEVNLKGHIYRAPDRKRDMLAAVQ